MKHDSEETVVFEKLNDLIDAYQLYPLIVKKDKNQSTSIYSILNANKKYDPLADKPTESVNPHLASLLEFVWSKIHEKYITIAHAFRYFDIRNAGEITKSDFLTGLENLKIKLTNSDFNQVFDYLDVSKDKVLTYGEFCNLCEERRRNIDPFLHKDSNQVSYVKLMSNQLEKPEIMTT